MSENRQQIFQMFPQKTRPSPLTPLSVLLSYLLLTHSCRGQYQMIGPPQPIVAAVGDDVILPCHVEPAVDVAAMTLEWMRPDPDYIVVYMWLDGQDHVHVKDPSYKDRASLFSDELKNGNISLKLSRVKTSDEGKYGCYIPKLKKGSSVELVVGAVSSPAIDLAGIERDKGGLMLACSSEGWYPEPEVLWLDGEGNLLSAGPPEPVRGPDDLYTVSSRVTVEKRHSNSFTCRVHQKNTNQTRETHISISNDFFNVQFSSSPVAALAACLAVCIVIISVVLFLVWKRTHMIINTKTSHWDEIHEGENRKCCETNRSEARRVTEGEREGEQLMTQEMVLMEVVNLGEGGSKTQHLEDNQQAIDMKRRKSDEELMENKNEEISQLKREFEEKLHAERTRREEAEKHVENLKKQLQTKDRPITGWELYIRVNNKDPIICTFDNSFNLNDEHNVTKSVPVYESHCPPIDLQWENLKSLNSGDKVQVAIISNTGDIQHLSVQATQGHFTKRAYK